MNQSWHDINSPGFLSAAPQKNGSVSSEVEMGDIQQTKAKEPEVRLSESAWAPIENSYQFNQKAKISVKVDYLKETNKKRITFDLFVESDAGLEDLKHQVEAFEEKGRAEAEVTLFYGDKYYDLLRKNPDALCKYIFKASHASLKAAFESEPLEMPIQQKPAVSFVEIKDVHFTKNSAVPLLDMNDQFVGALVSAHRYFQKNPSKYLVVLGHTDTTGTDQYNQELSEYRALAVKSFFNNSKDLWTDTVLKKNNVEDYQQILSTLYSKYGWPCDPGKVDGIRGPKTALAIEDFQKQYNLEYAPPLEVNGTMDKSTWCAFHTVIYDIIKTSFSDSNIEIKFGLGGKGYKGFGEKAPIEEVNKDQYDSATNRRVEIAFFDNDNEPDGTFLADKKRKWKKIPPVKVEVIPKGTVVFTVKKGTEPAWGFDKFGELSYSDKDGTNSKASPEPSHDFLSIKLNAKASVTAELNGLKPQNVFFVSSDPSVCKPHSEKPDSSPFQLEITAGTKNKAEAFIEARIGSSTGKIAGKIGVVVLSDIIYKAKVFPVVDPKSAKTKLVKTCTKKELEDAITAHFKAGIVSWNLATDAETKIEYDLQKNGGLDFEPGSESKELKKVKAGCVSPKGYARVIIVAKLRWCFYLKKDAQSTDTVLELKKYNKTYIEYFGMRNYTIQDDKGNSVQVSIKSVDGTNAKITLMSAIGKNFKISDKAALLFPLAGLSGDPTLISESDISSKAELLNVIAHELGHTSGGLSDLCEKGNIMFGIAQGGAPPLKLRRRGISRYYKPAKQEEQWLALNGR